MRDFLTTALVLAASAACGAAAAAPMVEIDHAVARVTVLPEARPDITVTVTRANPRLPLRISRDGDRVVIDGGLTMRPHGCHTAFGHTRVFVFGLGDFDLADLPQVVVHAPMDVDVGAGDTVFGAIGRSGSVDLRIGGCGGWTVANVAGPMRISISGSGDARTGAAGSADLRISGSGDIHTREIRGGLTAATSGSGDIEAAAIHGPLRVHVAGSGDVRAHGGEATEMRVSVSGSGDVLFSGVAQSLEASIAGSGDVTVGRVTGSVTKHVAGSGEVRIGG
ncbi:MAG TPA: DUF2807 domain-containing protein [Caulobacteraceae bacterium]|nr:DUF2807 domain-containing protein [Caulobacteraceae bacterium]